MLELTPVDFDFEKQTVLINKPYQHLHREEVITTPKTKKSNGNLLVENQIISKNLGRVMHLPRKSSV